MITTLVDEARGVAAILDAFADVAAKDASLNPEALRLRAEIAYGTLKALGDGTLQDCPHAAPFRYCPSCVVSPCPLGLVMRPAQGRNDG